MPIKGTVKWFSNRKGYGFITPSSDNSPTKEDIFVHQSNIVTEAEYRTLKDGFEVEFEAITDDSGKLTAQNVTASDGSPCPGPEPRETRRRRLGKGGVAAESGDGSADKTQGDAENSDSGAKDEREKKGRNRRRRRRNRNGKKSKEENKSEAKQEEKSWHMGLEENVKKSLEDRSIKTDNGRAFLAMGDSRIKLGTLGYLAIAHASGLLAEGTYTCDKDGKVTATWQHVLKYDGAEWKPSAADDEKEILVAEFSLVDESIKATGNHETPERLWGEGKSDPREALEKCGMQMRKIVLHAGERRRGRGRGRGRRIGKKKDTGKNGEKQAQGPVAESTE